MYIYKRTQIHAKPLVSETVATFSDDQWTEALNRIRNDLPYRWTDLVSLSVLPRHHHVSALLNNGVLLELESDYDEEDDE